MKKVNRREPATPGLSTRPASTAAGTAAAAGAQPANGDSDDGELRPQYDFRGGVRGKYVARYREGTNVVVLDPDVAARFPDAASVNRALRAVAALADGTPPPPKRARSRRRRTA
jgi:hypothetical protein